MGKKQVQKELKIFAARAKKNLKAEKVILFGSYATGKADGYSDVDVAVLSKIFAKVPFEKRLDILYPLIKDFELDFHPFGLTPLELTKTSPVSILSEIRSSGRVIV